jgi:uncharacterized repeat protein (TIGR01451 family)
MLTKLKFAVSPSLLAIMLTVASPGVHAQTAAAQEKKPVAEKANEKIVAKLEQYRVVKDEQGREKLESAATIKPGEVIEYRVVYKNVTAQAVSNMAATLPVPKDTVYVAKSAQTSKPGVKPAEAAAEDGQYAVEPLMHIPPGKSKSEPRPYRDYRFLRWQLGSIAPGGEVQVSARVSVSTEAPVAAGPNVSQPNAAR